MLLLLCHNRKLPESLILQQCLRSLVSVFLLHAQEHEQAEGHCACCSVLQYYVKVRGSKNLPRACSRKMTRLVGNILCLISRQNSFINCHQPIMNFNVFRVSGLWCHTFRNISYSCCSLLPCAEACMHALQVGLECESCQTLCAVAKAKGINHARSATPKQAWCNE